MRLTLVLLLASLAWGASACGDPSGPQTAQTGTQPTSAGSGGAAPAVAEATAGQGGAAPAAAGQGGASGQSGAGGAVVDENGCTEASKVVHVIAKKKELFRFDPLTGGLASVTKLACANGSGTYSMAIARDGRGYLVLLDGSLQRFDLTTGACEQTPFASGQLGFKTFGMGFVSSDNEQETLFVTHSKGDRLGKIDLTTYALSEVGSFDALQGSSSEIAGTSAGELFGVFQRSPSAIAQIDPQTAKIVSVADDLAMPFPTLSHFAVAAYGGKIWTFLGPKGSTDVHAFDPVTKASSKTATLSIEVIGAGVSTCAPRSVP